MNFSLPQKQNYIVNGLKLSALEWDQGQTPLLLLHGLADQSVIWASLGNFLAPNYHILAPDLRGHGESDKPSTGYFFANYITDLNTLLSQKGWESVHVVAHSWSAKLVCLWATQQPEKFKSLILVDPFFIGTISPIFKLTFPLLYRLLSFLKLGQSFPDFKSIEARAKQLPEYQGWSELQQKVFLANVEEKPDHTWSSKFIKPARDEIFSECMTVPGLTRSLSLPTLLIKSTKGVNRSDLQLKLYYQYLKQLEIQTIVGNHWAFMTNPADFNFRVSDFLSKF